jgi:hypothetical protein
MFALINQPFLAMKTIIEEYFRTDRSHATGSGLVSRFSKRLALKKQVNLQPANDYMTGVIHEELRELAGLSRKDLMSILAEPLKPAEQGEASVTDPGEPKAPKASKVQKDHRTPNAGKPKKASRKK